MFQVDVTEFESGTQEMLHMTQDIRLAVARTKGALDALIPKAAGEWWEFGNYRTSKFQRKLEALETVLKSATDAYQEASYVLVDDLRPKYKRVFSEAGTSISGKILSYDSSEAPFVSSCHGYLTSSSASLDGSISSAKDMAAHLDAPYGMTVPLSNLQSRVSNACVVEGNTHSAFCAYRIAVEGFEGEYAKKLSEREIGIDAAKRMSDALSDITDFSGIAEHLLEFGELVGSWIDHSWKYESSLPPLYHVPFKNYIGSIVKDGWRAAGETLDFLRPDKWGDSWKQLVTGVADEKASTGDFFKTVIGGSGSASKATNRLQAAGNIIGYAGDAIELVGIGAKAVSAGVNTEGSVVDKIAAGAGEAVKGVAKFAVTEVAGKAGSAIGSTIGSAFFPPLGTVVGGAIGGVVASVAADYAWEWGENLIGSIGKLFGS